MPKNFTMTTNQGPSASNQTSTDHSRERKQPARQPDLSQVMKAEDVGAVSNAEFTAPSKK